MLLVIASYNGESFPLFLIPPENSFRINYYYYQPYFLRSRAFVRSQTFDIWSQELLA